MIDLFANPAIQQFINENLNSDPSALALRYKEVGGVPIRLIIQQINGRQKAKNKLPSWFSKSGIVYPPALNVEQSSSEVTAEYKATLVKGKTIADLTGGFGIDTCAFSRRFEKVFYVERNNALAEIVGYNLGVLGITNVEVFITESSEFLEKAGKLDCIYLDPARRDDKNKKVFKLEECEPDIVSMLPQLFEKTDQVLVKTSPLLDIKMALNELQFVSQVHIIAVDNDCKEVLYLLNRHKADSPDVVTVNYQGQYTQTFQFKLIQEEKAKAEITEPLTFLYEPNAAVLKAGAFNIVGKQFAISKLNINSHLYTSVSLVEDFPGRKFEIIAVTKYDRKAIEDVLKTKQVNITVRNFPDSVEQIRKKTGLREGGEFYLFGTKDLKNKPIMIITKKL